MTKEELANVVRMDEGTQIFTVEFIKRTTGELRVMNCRKKVNIGVKGIGHSFIPAEKNLVCVWDMQKEDYRFINLDDVLRVKIHGKEYVVS